MTIPRPTPWGWHQLRNIALFIVAFAGMVYAPKPVWTWLIFGLAVAAAVINALWVWTRHLGPQFKRIERLVATDKPEGTTG